MSAADPAPKPTEQEPPAAPQIRDAASVVAVRHGAGGPRVLMGRRGQSAAFMPSKVVFPGGAVDPADHDAARVLAPPAAMAAHLGRHRDEERPADPALGAALMLAAVRELWEETGVAPTAAGRALGQALPPPWQRYVDRNGSPPLDAMHYLFRAVTPPGRPRRFDARFLLIDAACLRDPDDFSGADGELSDLGWRTIPEALSEDLPFVTALVLAEVAALPGLDAGNASALAAGPPFFRHVEGRSIIDRA